MAGTSPSTERRALVRAEVAAGGVTGLKDLAGRLADAGVDVTPDQLRADLRALGAVRVEGPDGPVLAIPVDGDRSAGRGAAPATLAATVADDADWKLQVGVLVVVVVFVLVALLGWLISV